MRPVLPEALSDSAAVAPGASPEAELPVRSAQPDAEMESLFLRPLLRLWNHRLLVLVMAALTLTGAFAISFQLGRLILLAATGAILTALALSALGRLLASRRIALAHRMFDRLTRSDPDVLSLTSGDGEPLANRAFRHGPTYPSPKEVLAGWCADPAQVIRDLIGEQASFGRARRDFARGSAGLRLTVHPVHSGILGGEAEVLMWRFAAVDRPGRRGIDALGLPILTMDAAGQPVMVNAALSRLLAGPKVTEASDPRAAATTEILGSILAKFHEAETDEPLVRMPSGQARRVLTLEGRDGLRDLVFLPIDISKALISSGLSPQDYEDIPVALIQIDSKGHIYGSNHAARSLMGLLPGEQRPFWEVVEGLGRPVSDWLQDARAGRALNRPEFLRARLASTETYVQVILREAVGTAPAGALTAVIADATELKSLEARFVQSQKMQGMGQLVGGIAHDFNNLLTAISGHCDLLLLDCDPFDPDYDDLRQISVNAERAAALVRQLLAFSRRQTMQPEVFGVEELLENVVQMLMRLVGERIGLRLEHGEGVENIRADRRQLEQVIMNLVVNARDAMPMGGEILIETELRSFKQPVMVGRARVPPGKYVLIHVSDTGMGIPEDLLEKIFEPFFTTKRVGEGTGLGLSTAYGIMKQMGGFIFVDSEEGVGTCFTLYFTAKDMETLPNRRVDMGPKTTERAHLRALGDAGHSIRDMLPEETRRDASPSNGTPVRRYDGGVKGIVLLVEDEAPVRAFAARALRLKGYQVLEAEDGEQALKVASDPALQIDIFVTDVIMPGLDGPSWVNEVLKIRRGTPVVFVSGYIEAAVSEGFAAIPRSSFLEKPFSLDGLTEAIEQHLLQHAL